jgi:hypothetical protein
VRPELCLLNASKAIMTDVLECARLWIWMLPGALAITCVNGNSLSLISLWVVWYGGSRPASLIERS